MYRTRRLRWLALLCALVVLAAACGGGRDEETGGGGEGGQEADPGIDEATIKLGGSYPLSGAASAYAVIGQSVSAYFAYLNEEFGGVEMGDGVTRKIEFTIYDDAYTPSRTVENTRRLIEQDGVFAIFNTLGTPPNTAIIDYMNQVEVPQIFVATGASNWGRDVEQYPWTMGWQPAYPTESAIYGTYLAENNPGARVAILYQNDDYGKDYLEGFKAAIEGTDIEIVAEESYQVTDPTVSSQMTNLARSNADVFFNITTPKFAAQAIQAMAQTGWRPLHLLNSVSASIESVLKPAGPQNAVGAISAAYFKSADDPQWDNDPAMQLYKEKAEQYGDFNLLDPFGVYGFTIGEAFVKGVLERMEAPTRQAMMDAARSMDGIEVTLMLPGITMTTNGAEDGFPLEAMQLEEFDGTTWKLQGEIIDYEGRTPVPGEA
jgi:branched-chain amino acid transport system substrate-binding protein